VDGFDMNEAQWLECPLAERLLNHVKGQASQRQLRLFGAACCRRCWNLLSPPARTAVEVLEHFADGQCGPEALASARNRTFEEVVAHALQAPKPSGCWGAIRSTARAAVEAVAHGPIWSAAPIGDRIETCEALRAAEKEAQAVLLRCIIGNPFHPIVFDPAWRTHTVQDLTSAAYEERILPAGELDVARLAVLADAVEETGCMEQSVLDHLRSPEAHVRGCWAIDLLVKTDR
jgi:hypothetical protein